MCALEAWNIHACHRQHGTSSQTANLPARPTYPLGHKLPAACASPPQPDSRNCFLPRPAGEQWIALGMTSAEFAEVYSPCTEGDS